MWNSARWWTLGIGILFSGIVLLPLAVYFAGQLIVGPYEGPGGLAEFLGSIYRGALQGGAGLLLILSPALMVGIWWLVAWLRRRAGSEAGG